MSDLSQRKTDHIELTLRSDVAFRKTTLLEEVELIHQSLPELDYHRISTELDWFGRRLKAPLLIASMTGGNERAGELNRKLGEVAERGGYAIGLGSQRAMVKDGQIHREIAETYAIRKVAPSVPILANLGVVQAGMMSTEAILEMIGCVEADALIVHLNPAQEMIQADGDRDFRGAEATLARLRTELTVPLIVKETGAGLSREVATRLRQMGVEHVDVSGAGGTSWTAVETRRASGELKERGELFWDWGIPTAASLLEVRPLQFETVIATGGIQSGLDVARAVALGAQLAGIARRTLVALDSGGVEGALTYLRGVEGQLKTAMLLTGAGNLSALGRVRTILGPRLCAYRDSSPRPPF